MAIADNMPNDRPGDMARRIADLERAVRELRAARDLDQASITPEPGMGIRTGDFDGTDFADPGTVGNYFGGDGIVLNQAYFRPGSVSNDALTDPLETAQRHDDAQNFSLSTAWTYPLSVVIPIPTGFTEALVQGIVGVSANNSTASGDYLFGDISIPVYGASLPGFTIGSALIGAGAGGISWQATSVQLTGLSGPSFTVNGAVSTGFGSWAASTGNVANLDVTVTFTR